MSSHTLLFRIITDIVLFLCLFFIPWWLWLLLCALSVFVFDYQYEVLVLAFLADSSYGVPVLAHFFGANLFFLVVTTLLLMCALIVKPQLTFYTKISL